jgi:small subunit ribosomal protein S6
MERRNFFMRAYELIVIIHPGLDEAAVNQTLEKIKGWITTAGGTISTTDVWGKRRLAYQIQKQRDGLYYLLNIQMVPTANADLERNLRILEPVMRFSIIAKEE